MTSYAVFLRGVNVGGVTIKMNELKDALEAAGFANTKTLLVSGNVVLSSNKDAAAVKVSVEGCLRNSFGYDAWVVVLTAERVIQLIADCPYPSDDAETHTYVTLSSDAHVLTELRHAGATGGTELTSLGLDAIAWLAPAGGTLDSPFSKLTSKARYKSTTTTRNLRTMIKVRNALGNQER
ncbi:DUF1697 domain-containing protein [Pseudarthrobacter sp. PS3-L1]|uniref:DUF1697 domain-containing protein n=1 Tax=Pseudarthrobacter sp. PS3-L1 TaxID=3046207 RepID=UPI0024BA2DA0|nr:DUF1697 domain-containing protein [Pseudarthrobacter sp. PS3-L1]MDJ0321730.1 DUF1697 domain-containing protein [Pseudarthrobacter sp. PS3-L1]